MLRLHCGRCNVLLAGGGLFGRRRPGGHTACAAVIAHAIHRDIVVDYGLVVGVVHDGDVYVAHGTVIDECAAAPISARITHAGVAETVIDSAIKTDVWFPVPGVPNVDATSSAPIARSPKESNLRRDDPCTRNPEVTVRSPVPVAGNPDEAVAGTCWLLVNRQRWRSDVHRYPDAYLRQRRGRYHQHSGEK